MDVFELVADPTRREVLARLRVGGPLTLSQLAAGLPVTRQAVTRHVDVLSAAGLVDVRRVGRERHHRLNARPLRELADWLEPYAAAWDERLARLAELVAEQPAGQPAGTDDRTDGSTEDQATEDQATEPQRGPAPGPTEEAGPHR